MKKQSTIEAALANLKAEIVKISAEIEALEASKLALSSEHAFEDYRDKVARCLALKERTNTLNWVLK